MNLKSFTIHFKKYYQIINFETCPCTDITYCSKPSLSGCHKNFHTFHYLKGKRKEMWTNPILSIKLNLTFWCLDALMHSTGIHEGWMVQVYRLFLDHTFLKALYCKRKHARVELTIKVIYLGKKHSKECPAQSHDDAFVQRVVVRV